MLKRCRLRAAKGLAAGRCKDDDNNLAMTGNKAVLTDSCHD